MIFKHTHSGRGKFLGWNKLFHSNGHDDTMLFAEYKLTKKSLKNQLKNCCRNHHGNNCKSDFLKSTEFNSVDSSIDFSGEQNYHSKTSQNQRNDRHKNQRGNKRKSGFLKSTESC